MKYSHTNRGLKRLVRFFSHKKRHHSNSHINDGVQHYSDGRIDGGVQNEGEPKVPFYSVVEYSSDAQQLNRGTKEARQEPEDDQEFTSHIPDVTRVDTMHADIEIPDDCSRCGKEITIDHDGPKTIKLPLGQEGQCIRVKMIRPRPEVPVKPDL